MSDIKREIIRELAGQFVTATRDDGSEFRKLADGHPEWMQDLCRECHGDMLPDDWRYRMIEDIAQGLADSDPDEWDGDATHEIIDGAVPIFNWDRLQWLSSHLSRAFYCDDAREEGLLADDADMFQRIAAGMYQEYSEIYAAMVQEIENRAEELADEEDDE